MKKIVLVNQVAGPMFVDMANFYLNNGFDVQLLTGKVEQTAHCLDNDVKIVKLISYKRNHPITRIITWLIFTVQTYLLLKRLEENVEVLLVSNPPFVPLLGYFLRSKCNLVFKILIYDIYPDVLENSGYFKRNSWFSRRWRQLNIYAYNQASKLYTVSDGMKNILTQYASDIKWNVVYPWVDTNFIKPISKSENPFVKKYGLENKLVILYSGNMGATHNLMPLLYLAKSLIDHKNFLFLFIGDGVGKQRLADFAKKQNLTNTLFLPFQSSETLPFSLTSADIGVVSLSGSSAQLSIPSKIFYQLSAGNCILCITEEDSELSKIIIENKCGFIFSSVEKVKEILLSMTEADLSVLKSNALISVHKYTNNNLILFQ